MCIAYTFDPASLLIDVDEALAALSERYRLVLITKGDLMDQERKVAASGLGDLFAAVEIVSEKDRGTYGRVFARHGTGADEAVMAGNSVKSDIIPAIEAGAFAVHIPYHVTWAHELAEPPVDHPRFGLLDINKARGDVFLDRIEELLRERGHAVKRYAKSRFSILAPTELKQKIAAECDIVIEALAD